MTIDILMLVVSLGMILLASVVFTNGIEHIGKRCGFHQGVTGSILAAVGTALPETIIPVIAIVFFTSETGHEVGVGAIVGAPFMLATLAFFITGAAVYASAWAGLRPRTIRIDATGLRRDLSFFIVLYGAAVLISFLHAMAWVRWLGGLSLVAGYGLYLHRTMQSEGHEAEDVEALHFNRYFRFPDSSTTLAVQVLASLALMTWGAHLFVGYVSLISSSLGISATLLSIIITPIATELPEKCNSILWIRKEKDILALGNITGALVFQSSFPVAFGVAFTAWDLHGIPLLSALLALAAAISVYLWVRVRNTLPPALLTGCVLFYLVFVACLLRGGSAR